jgi:hypothetical protein
MGFNLLHFINKYRHMERISLRNLIKKKISMAKLFIVVKGYKFGRNYFRIIITRTNKLRLTQ